MAPERRPLGTLRIVAGLVLGVAVVASGPAWLTWQWMKPPSWNESTLNAQFQSVRYESGGLVFRYAVRNLTGQVAQFRPTLTEIHALQAKNQPSVGYPNVLLPFDVPARGSHVLEVRLELPSARSLSSGVTFATPLMEELPGQTMPESPAAPPPVILGPQEALNELDGFELVDSVNGLRLVLPRAW